MPFSRQFSDRHEGRNIPMAAMRPQIMQKNSDLPRVNKGLKTPTAGYVVS